MLRVVLVVIYTFQIQLFLLNETYTEPEKHILDALIIEEQLTAQNNINLTQTTVELMLNITEDEKKEKNNETSNDMPILDKDVQNDTFKILSFKEWKGIKNNDNLGDEDIPFTHPNNNYIDNALDYPTDSQALQNFASKDCGARIISSNPESSHSSMILNDNLDSYALNPCTVFDSYGDEIPTKIWFVIQLCEQIEIHSFGLSNMESYSSNPKTVRISYSFSPSRHDSEQVWRDAGTYTLENSRKFQIFKLDQVTQYTRIIKIEILESYKTEPYCPLTLVHIYGASFVDKISFKPVDFASTRNSVEIQNTESFNIDIPNKVDNETARSGSTYFSKFLEYIKSKSTKLKLYNKIFARDPSPSTHPNTNHNHTVENHDEITIMSKDSPPDPAISHASEDNAEHTVDDDNEPIDADGNFSIVKKSYSNWPKKISMATHLQQYNKQAYFCSNESLSCSWNLILFKKVLSNPEKYCLEYLILLNRTKTNTSVILNHNLTKPECNNSKINHTSPKECLVNNTQQELNGTSSHRRSDTPINTFDAMNLIIKELKKNLTLTTHYLEEVSVNFREAIDDIRKQTMGKINLLEKNNQIILTHIETLLNHISQKNESSYLLLAYFVNEFESFFSVFSHPILIYVCVFNSFFANIYLLYLCYGGIRDSLHAFFWNLFLSRYRKKDKFVSPTKLVENGNAFEDTNRSPGIRTQSLDNYQNSSLRQNYAFKPSTNFDNDNCNDSKNSHNGNSDSPNIINHKPQKKKHKNKQTSQNSIKSSSGDSSFFNINESSQQTLCHRLSSCRL